MLLFLVFLFSFIQGAIEYIRILNGGTDEEKCGTIDSPCQSFDYIFESRLVNKEDEKGVLIPNGFSLSQNQGSLRLFNVTPQYHLYGQDYRNYGFSRVDVPNGCGHIHCEQSVRIEYLRFESESGVFHDITKDEVAFIYSNVSGVHIYIVNCSFATGENYNSVNGSSTALLFIHSGATLTMNLVNISDFNILNRRFIDIGEGYPSVEVNITSLIISRITVHDTSDIVGIFHLTNTTIHFRDCFFNESQGYGPASFAYEYYLIS
jgi:hypothetical protein